MRESRVYRMPHHKRALLDSLMNLNFERIKRHYSSGIGGKEMTEQAVTKQIKFVSNYDRENQLILKIEELIGGNKQVDMVEEVHFDGKQNTLSQGKKHIEVYSSGWIKVDKKDYTCRCVKLASIKDTVYFMGRLHEYNGFIPKEVCQTIEKIMPFVDQHSGFDLRIIDHDYRRFKEYEVPKGDPMLVLHRASTNTIWILERWGAE